MHGFCTGLFLGNLNLYLWLSLTFFWGYLDSFGIASEVHDFFLSRRFCHSFKLTLSWITTRTRDGSFRLSFVDFNILITSNHWIFSNSECQIKQMLANISIHVPITVLRIDIFQHRSSNMLYALQQTASILLPGPFIGSANEKAAGKTRILVVQDSGAENI